MKGARSWAFSTAPLSSKGVAGTHEGRARKMFNGRVWALASKKRRAAVPQTFASSCGSATTDVVPWGRAISAKRAGVTMLDSRWMWASMKPGSR